MHAKSDTIVSGASTSVSYDERITDVIAGDVIDYHCTTSNDGVPEATRMLWYIDNESYGPCANLSLDDSCHIVVNGSLHGLSLRCQEFQVHYKTGGFDELTFNVLCKILPFYHYKAVFVWISNEVYLCA